MWAHATALAFGMLMQEACAEVAKPEWWSDEGLKALSARVVRAVPDNADANRMRAEVLRGHNFAWESGPRSAAELREAATHYERAAALHPAPAAKAHESSPISQSGAAAGQRPCSSSLEIMAEAGGRGRRAEANVPLLSVGVAGYPLKVSSAF